MSLNKEFISHLYERKFLLKGDITELNKMAMPCGSSAADYAMHVQQKKLKAEQLKMIDDIIELYLEL